MTPTINPAFKFLIPPHTREESTGLEAQILAEGCRDPIVTWNGTIVDGHNRFEICQRHGLKFTVHPMAFDDEIHARLWIRANQRNRRNLSSAWLIELALGDKDDLKELGRQKKVEGGKRARSKQLGVLPILGKTQSVKHRTQEAIAEAAEVSHSTVARAEVIKRKNPELWEQAKAGEITVGAAYKKATVHVGHNSGENEWYTPQPFIDAAVSAMGSIDCDPASSKEANRTVRAKRYFTKEDDGLTHEWNGNVWLNPPYAQPLIRHFSDAVCRKSTDREFKQACVLVNNATETEWFSNMARIAAAICFPGTRIKFIDMNGKASGAPLQGQAVIYIGPRVAEFIKAFGGFGFILCRP